MATFYHWQDSGVPTLSGDYFTGFRDLLIACLVNGYGAKAGAGWTLLHSVAGGFSLENSRGYVVNFVASNPGTYYGGVFIYLAEGVTDTSGPMVVADVLRSGKGSPGSSKQAINTALSFSSTQGFSNLTWTLVADDRTFAFYAKGFHYGYNTSLPWPLLYVGDDSEGNFLSIGGLNVTTLTSLAGQFGDGGSTYLRDPLSGLLITTEPALILLGVTPAARVAHTVLDGELSLIPLYLKTGTTIFSRLRGMVFDPGKQGFAEETMFSLLGLTPSVSDRGKPVTLSGTTVALVEGSQSQTNYMLFTDDPEYW